MTSLWILLIAMLMVVGGVLILRLHAFLALILGALTVAALTPTDAIVQSGLRSAGIGVVSIDAARHRATLKIGEKQKFLEGNHFVLVAGEKPHSLALGAHLMLKLIEKDKQRVLVEIANGESLALLQPGILLLHHTQAADVRATANQTIGQRIATGFGHTCRGVGILIAMAAIIGKCLLESGAAQRIVISARHTVGEQHTPLAFLGSGFIVGIPVFFDTVFFLLMPLGKAMCVRTGKSYLLCILSIVAGATMAHSLVPPTPGPMFVANELGVDLGAMMLGGGMVALCCALAGYGFAKFANARMQIPIRPSAELTAEELEAMAHLDENTLPSLGLSLLPILLPIVLIAGNTIFTLLSGNVPPVMKLLGDKNIAMTIAAAIALATFAWTKRASGTEMAASVQVALAGGGVIILITAAGGAFGHVLRQTDIAGTIQQWIPESQAGLLFIVIAFTITMVVRVAQGSATVAMITAVGIIGPVATNIDLPYNRLYLALAIGCGSKPLNWMNDSGFWIISKMSGMTEGETLKTVTVMLTIMGLVGLGATLLGATLLPLIS
ncbi:MAG: gluconate permease [Pirellulales bacterium]